uniref:Uncharacterized protein n=1 Tax=Timema douglasi TaxID=61478 RepID=A0A7R8VH99_TIMDO|nr:unnamed protein product [Timema douglasi]
MRTGSGWTVTVAGTTTFPQDHHDVEMRLSFPACSRRHTASQSDSGVGEDTNNNGGHHGESQSHFLPPAQMNNTQHWSLTVKNQTGGFDKKQGEEKNGKKLYQCLPDLTLHTDQRPDTGLPVTSVVDEETLKVRAQRRLSLASWPKVHKIVQNKVIIRKASGNVSQEVRSVSHLLEDESGHLVLKSGLTITGSAITPEKKPRVPTMSERDVTRMHTTKGCSSCVGIVKGEVTLGPTVNQIGLTFSVMWSQHGRKTIELTYHLCLHLAVLQGSHTNTSPQQPGLRSTETRNIFSDVTPQGCPAPEKKIRDDQHAQIGSGYDFPQALKGEALLEFLNGESQLWTVHRLPVPLVAPVSKPRPHPFSELRHSSEARMRVSAVLNRYQWLRRPLLPPHHPLLCESQLRCESVAPCDWTGWGDSSLLLAKAVSRATLESQKWLRYLISQEKLDDSIEEDPSLEVESLCIASELPPKRVRKFKKIPGELTEDVLACFDPWRFPELKQGLPANAFNKICDFLPNIDRGKLTEELKSFVQDWTQMSSTLKEEYSKDMDSENHQRDMLLLLAEYGEGIVKRNSIGGMGQRRERWPTTLFMSRTRECLDELAKERSIYFQQLQELHNTLSDITTECCDSDTFLDVTGTPSSVNLRMGKTDLITSPAKVVQFRHDSEDTTMPREDQMEILRAIQELTQSLPDTAILNTDEASTLRVALALKAKAGELPPGRDKHQANFLLTLAADYPDLPEQIQQTLIHRINIVNIALTKGWQTAIAAAGGDQEAAIYLPNFVPPPPIPRTAFTFQPVRESIGGFGSAPRRRGRGRRTREDE